MQPIWIDWYEPAAHEQWLESLRKQADEKAKVNQVFGSHAAAPLRSPRRGQGERKASHFAIAVGLVALCALLVIVLT